MKIKNLALVVVLVGLTVGAGAEEEEKEASARFGEGKAIEAFDKEQGFKLSEKAQKNLGVEFMKVHGSGPWKIPKDALVKLKQSTGIYRLYDGFISMVLVKVSREAGADIYITSADLEDGDEVAFRGATFLRMTDADLNTGTVDSCAH
ncbi:MAG: hypothetical protein EOP06_02170 [Proteobacteria bacterium]|jgi:hypothetical protein|nr:MAG: hypothetical protein EOP06_02170 [Pseudomonadota bacterium]